MVNQLLENNRRWAQRLTEEDSGFFERLSGQQAPEYLWIGCSDSRVPANEIVGLDPGELFVHRNIGNLVHLADMNCLSVLEFAVERLGVKHIIVCGHYGCSGVRTAMEKEGSDLTSHWLAPIGDTIRLYRDQLMQHEDIGARLDALCEINVIRQVERLSRNRIIEGAWARGQNLAIHGWVYGLKDGRVRDLEVSINKPLPGSPPAL